MLQGVDPAEGEVEVQHLEILSSILWTDPTEQPVKCGKIVARIANPTGAQVVEIITQAQDVLTKDKISDAIPKLEDF